MKTVFSLLAGMFCLCAVAAQTDTAQTTSQRPAAAKPHAHVHGIGKLQIAIDGNTLLLNLETPLDNLIGFEHVPRTEVQKAALNKMVARLNKASTLFLPTAAADCTPESNKASPPQAAGYSQNSASWRSSWIL